MTARLRDGATIAQATAAMDVLAPVIAAGLPEESWLGLPFWEVFLAEEDAPRAREDFELGVVGSDQRDARDGDLHAGRRDGAGGH